MYLQKLINILRPLSPAQHKRLIKYIASPYFPVYPPSVTLFNYLCPLHPLYPPSNITLQQIATQYKSLDNNKKLATAATRLLRAVEEFLALEQWLKNPAWRTRCTVMAYKELNLLSEAARLSQKQLNRLEQTPEQNPDSFYEKHLLTELTFNGFDARLHRTAQNSIMPVVKTLDEFYALKKLRYLCEAFNRRQVLGANIIYHEQHIPTIIKILESYTNPNYPYVYLFVNVLHMLMAKTFEDTEVPYSIIKNEAAAQSGKAITESLREAMGYAVNCTLNWFNSGITQAGNEYLWWIEWRMQNNLLLDNGKLMPVTFCNIIAASLNNRTPPQIEKLIATYAAYLPARLYDTNYNFAKGMHSYALKDYKNAVRFFALARGKKDAVFNCIIRRWQWLCLYECDPSDTDTLANQLVSLEKYMKRNKKELQHVTNAFHLFINNAHQLLHLSSLEITPHLLQQLTATPHFAGKPWLVQQFIIKSNKPVRVAHRLINS